MKKRHVLKLIRVMRKAMMQRAWTQYVKCRRLSRTIKSNIGHLNNMVLCMQHGDVLVLGGYMCSQNVQIADMCAPFRHHRKRELWMARRFGLLLRIVQHCFSVNK